MKMQIQETPLLRDIREAPTFRTPKNLFLQALLFFGVFLVINIVESFAVTAALLPRLISWATEQVTANNNLDSTIVMDKLNNMLNDPANTVLMLFCTASGTILAILYCRFAEGRKLCTMGFRKEHSVQQYLLGLLGGFAAFSMVVGIAVLFGGAEFVAFHGQFTPSLLLIFLGFGIQGMSEEVICRGFMMTATLRHHNMWWAAGINALVFGLAHALNPGFSILAMVNLLLYAVMISLYVMRTGNLWGACAYHSIWNFAQGNFYGLPVSGIDSGDTVFSMQLTGTTFVNGGDFGLEASIGCTIVLLLWIAGLLFIPNPFAKQSATPEGNA